MNRFYNFCILLYGLIAQILAIKNSKAKLWVEGRKNFFNKFSKNTLKNENMIWFHCASLGEFEQGRPLIEQIKKDYPQFKIWLTFFSPSGYEVRKNYPLADYISYLPNDTPKQVRLFFDIVNPKCIFFVKYDYWFNYINEAYRRKIPFYSISCIFRKKQIYFKLYGKWMLQNLKKITYFYCQDKESLLLLQNNGIEQVTICGDTRFDRVFSIVNQAKNNELIEKFVKEKFVVVAGSTWLPDEVLLCKLMKTNDFKLILVPHEVHERRIEEIQQIYAEYKCLKYSQINLQQEIDNVQVLIIDTIGLLSSIYRYAHIAYIGGGFGKGIHNTLEAATYGKPIVFGKKYQKFKEAKDLIACEAAFSVKNIMELEQIFNKLYFDSNYREKVSKNAETYVKTHIGATNKIITSIFSKQKLAN